MSENVGRVRIAPEILLHWLCLPGGHEVRHVEASTLTDGSIVTIDLIVVGPLMPPAPEDPSERAREAVLVFRERAHELLEVQHRPGPPR
jgi:hypothetical protein